MAKLPRSWFAVFLFVTYYLPTVLRCYLTLSDKQELPYQTLDIRHDIQCWLGPLLEVQVQNSDSQKRGNHRLGTVLDARARKVMHQNVFMFMGWGHFWKFERKK